MRWKDEPVVFLTKKTWKYSEGNRFWVIFYIFLFTIANTIELLWPLLIAKILNVIQEQGVTSINLQSILLYLLLFIALTVGFWIFHGPARVIEIKNAFLVRANYKKYLIDGVMTLPPEWHANHHSGNTIDRIEKSTTGLYSYSTDSFEVIETIVRFVGSYIALAYFNVHSSYIVLGMVVITIYLILRFDKILVSQYSELYKAENGISAKIFDTISNITTVIVLRIEKLFSNAIFRKIMQPFLLFRRNSKINEIKWFLVSLCASVMVVLVLFSYLYIEVKTGAVIMIGTVFALYSYVDKINSLFFRFAYKYSDIVKQKTAVLNGEEIAKDFIIKKKADFVTLNEDWKTVEIKSLSFSYPQKKAAKLHLDTISLVMRHGEKIAFIGDSGSGKTTMLKVMRDLYHPQTGTITLDGEILLRGFKSISTSISLIPQDPEIFSTTIKENITFGAPRTRAEIKVFTDIARFTDVVPQLPKGLNSFIFEKGVNLSGGQKQRLALARGLMASVDKEIILLDEPTSSIDSKNELEIYKNIFSYFKDKTIISSIHRLHLLTLFDTIYYFKDGKIIASGSFQDLLKLPHFKRMWEKYSKTMKEKER